MLVPLLLALQMTPVLPDKVPVKPDTRPAPELAAPSKAIKLYTTDRVTVSVPGVEGVGSPNFAADPQPLRITLSVPSRLLILSTIQAEVKECTQPDRCKSAVWIGSYLAVKRANEIADVFSDNPGTVGGELTQVFKEGRSDQRDGALSYTSGFASGGTFQSVTRVLPPGQYDVVLKVGNTRQHTAAASVLLQKTVEVIPDLP